MSNSLNDETNIPSTVSDVNASTSPTQFRWIQVVELGYIENNEAGSSGDGESEKPICFHCGSPLRKRGSFRNVPNVKSLLIGEFCHDMYEYVYRIHSQTWVCFLVETWHRSSRDCQVSYIIE